MRIGRMMVAGLLGVMVAGSALGQTQPAGPGGGGGPGGRPDPATMREQMVARIKTATGATDDEWKVLEPKLVKVLLLKMDVGEFGVPGGNAWSARINGFIRTMLDPNATTSEVDARLADLQKLIADNENSTDAYNNIMGQLRKARVKARELLNAAEKDLAGDLTVRQEAALVQMGLLE